MSFRSAHAVAWDAPAPGSLARVPSQLGKDCRAAYFHAAKNFFSPDGALVDGGALAGGSSRALLEGCRASGRTLEGRFLYAFDLFVCDEYNSGFFAKNFPGEWAPGASFRPLYEKAVEDFSDHVHIVEGDIAAFPAWRGPPIDVLGVDVWKTLELAEHGVRTFFPHLRAGAVVLQQDYNHWWLPFIHSLMEAFAGHFEKVHETVQWGTVVFQTVRPPSPEDIERALARHRDPQERKTLTASAYRRARRPHTALWIKLADCRRIAEQDGLPAALDALARARNEIAQLDPFLRPAFTTETEKFEALLRAVYSGN